MLGDEMSYYERSSRARRLLTIDPGNAPALQAPYKIADRALRDDFEELTDPLAGVEEIRGEVLVDRGTDRDQHELEARPLVEELQLSAL